MATKLNITFPKKNTNTNTNTNPLVFNFKKPTLSKIQMLPFDILNHIVLFINKENKGSSNCLETDIYISTLLAMSIIFPCTMYSIRKLMKDEYEYSIYKSHSKDLPLNFFLGTNIPLVVSNFILTEKISNLQNLISIYGAENLINFCGSKHYVRDIINLRIENYDVHGEISNIKLLDTYYGREFCYYLINSLPINKLKNFIGKINFNTLSNIAHNITNQYIDNYILSILQKTLTSSFKVDIVKLNNKERCDLIKCIFYNPKFRKNSDEHKKYIIDSIMLASYGLINNNILILKLLFENFINVDTTYIIDSIGRFMINNFNSIKLDTIEYYLQSLNKIIGYEKAIWNILGDCISNINSNSNSNSYYINPNCSLIDDKFAYSLLLYKGGKQFISKTLICDSIRECFIKDILNLIKYNSSNYIDFDFINKIILKDLQKLKDLEKSTVATVAAVANGPSVAIFDTAVDTDEHSNNILKLKENINRYYLIINNIILDDINESQIIEDIYNILIDFRITFKFCNSSACSSACSDCSKCKEFIDCKNNYVFPNTTQQLKNYIIEIKKFISEHKELDEENEKIRNVIMDKFRSILDEINNEDQLNILNKINNPNNLDNTYKINKIIKLNNLYEYCIKHVKYIIQNIKLKKAVYYSCTRIEIELNEPETHGLIYSYQLRETIAKLKPLLI